MPAVSATIYFVNSDGASPTPDHHHEIGPCCVAGSLGSHIGSKPKKQQGAIALITRLFCVWATRRSAVPSVTQPHFPQFQHAGLAAVYYFCRWESETRRDVGFRRGLSVIAGLKQKSGFWRGAGGVGWGGVG